MPTYQYRAVGPTGKLSAGRLEAQSVDDLRARLRRQGLRPVKALPVAATSLAERRGGGKVSPPLVVKALSELSVLLRAGLALDRALVIAIENVGHGPTRAVFQGVLDAMREGASLGRAVAQAGDAFPRMAAPMIDAGEASGSLARALAKLAETLKRAQALRQALISALIYPAMLLVIATGVVIFMFVGVIPQFEGMFGDNLDKLPNTTRTVLALSRAFRTYWLPGLLGLILAGVLLRFLANRPAIRVAIDRAALNAPVLGPLVTRIQVSRFARVLGSLVEGGVPLPSALALARAVLTNAHMATAVGGVVTGLRQGAGLTAPLGATGLFPNVALSFMRTGEETARLGEMLDQLADVLEAEARVALDRVIAILTPAITVVMGVIIASLIASIMSAILGFNDLAAAS